MARRKMITATHNVYEAAMERLDTVFREFDHIIVAFSGGKDSGVLLNLVIRYMRERGITRKIAVFHQDFEAQYTATTEYVERTLTSNLDLIQPYWCCLPCSCKTATSMHEQYWVPWHPDQREIWVRDLPQHPGVITLDNHPFDFYQFGMMQEDFYAGFAPWYHRAQGGQGRTICLVGIRAQESLNRWRAITADKSTYAGHPWTTQTAPQVYSGYPLYDWKAEDIWTANARFGFPYNRIYDLFYMAGVPLHQMRVASPFNDWAIGSLKLYRAIEPAIWGKMVGRVNGANFAALYGGTKAVGWKHVTLPKGHTWKSYVQFLLTTLPEETRQTYEAHFATSLEFWLTKGSRAKGGALSDETIRELRDMGIPIHPHPSPRTDQKRAVTFDEYPDDWQGSEFQLVPSYKRMAVCILKNDHLCKFMGFSHTKRQLEQRQAALDKYGDL